MAHRMRAICAALAIIEAASTHLAATVTVVATFGRIHSGCACPGSHRDNLVELAAMSGLMLLC